MVSGLGSNLQMSTVVAVKPLLRVVSSTTLSHGEKSEDEEKVKPYPVVGGGGGDEGRMVVRLI